MNAAPPRPSPSWSTREEQEEEEGTPSSSSSSPSPVQRGAVGGRWDRDMMEEMEEMEEEEAFSLPVEPFIIKREELEDEEEMQQQEEEEVEEEERWPRVKVEMDDSDDGCGRTNWLLLLLHVCGRRPVLRLDRIYVNDENINLLGDCGIKPTGLSDHHLITALLRLDVAQLEEKDFKTAFMTCWQHWGKTEDTSGPSSQWWEAIKAQVRALSMQLAGQRAAVLQALRRLENELLQLEAEIGKLKNTLTGLVFPGPDKASVKLSAYADDICVVINNREDVVALRRAVTDYENATGAKMLGAISTKLEVPFFRSSLVCGTPRRVDKRHSLANFVLAQAKMATYKTSKKKLQGEATAGEGCSAVAMTRGLLAARFKLEHEYYAQQRGTPTKRVTNRRKASKTVQCGAHGGQEARCEQRPRRPEEGDHARTHDSSTRPATRRGKQNKGASVCNVLTAPKSDPRASMRDTAVKTRDSTARSSHVKQEDDLAYEIWQRSRLKYEDGDGGDDDDDGGGGSGPTVELI
ncbi:unnamed protein product [Lampetra planeri]